MAVKGSKEKQWKKLLDILEQCKDDIQYDQKNDIAYYLEGQTYAKMYKISNDKQYLLKAVASFSKAIENNSEKGSYLADRSRAYVDLDQPENAIKDLQLISKMPQDKNIDNLYTKHVQKSLVKLNSIKSTIDKLRLNKQLPDDFLQSYEQLVNVTQGLVLKVELQGQQISGIKQKYRELQEKFNQLLNQAQKGKMTVKQMNKQILQLRQKVILIQNSMVKYVSKDQLEQMSASIDQRFGATQKKFELFNSKIIIIQGEVDQQKVKYAHIDESLRKCNIYKKNQVKDKFAQLRGNDAQLYEYANVFYWTFSNYILAYRVISTGLVEGKQEDNTLVSLAKKVTGLFSDTISSIPGVGGVITLIEQGLNALYEGYKAEKLARKVQRINQFVSKNALQEDINLGILIAAIQISSIREPIIKADPNKKHNQEVYQHFMQARAWFEEKLDKIMTKITGIKKVYETNASKAALTDVLLLLGYLMISDQTIVKNGDDIFHEEIVAQFKTAILRDQLIELKKNQKKPSKWFSWSK